MQPYHTEVGAGTFNPATFLRCARARAVAHRLRRAVDPPDRRPLRREPVPAAALLPVPGAAQAVARRRPGDLPRLARGASASIRARTTLRFVEDNWEGADARAPGAPAGRSGSTAWRSRSSPTSSRPAASTSTRSRVEMTYGARAPRDVPAGRGLGLRHRVGAGRHLRRRVPRERAPVVDLQLRGRRRRHAAAAFRGLRGGVPALPRARAAAARLRLRAEVLARLQPARRARRDLGDRARRRTSRACATSPAPWRRRTLRSARRPRRRERAGPAGRARLRGAAAGRLRRGATPARARSSSASCVPAGSRPQESAPWSRRDASPCWPTACPPCSRPRRRAPWPAGERRARRRGSTDGRRGLRTPARRRPDGLERRDGFVWASVAAPERPADELVHEVVDALVDGLQIPKNMRWGRGTLRFARPIRTLCVLHGDSPLRWSWKARSGRDARSAATVSCRVARARSALRSSSRAQMTTSRRCGRHASSSTTAPGARPSSAGSTPTRAGAIPPACCDEVVDLVEWPSVLRGSFDPEYLSFRRA